MFMNFMTSSPHVISRVFCNCVVNLLMFNDFILDVSESLKSANKVIPSTSSKTWKAWQTQQEKMQLGRTTNYIQSWKKEHNTVTTN